ncbi:zf-TFIIB domain-containing protein [Candidatus Woesearchaeota archaeon]|nr:zf-TFIIB domain-containing protein [Candidatus Woesearchaeota archaeon]
MKKIGRTKQFLSWLFLGRRLNLSEDVILICPRCNSKLKKVQKEKITIDVCPHCNGMWLDDGEIDKLVKKVKTNGKKTNKK